jgi:hypothetical protein
MKTARRQELRTNELAQSIDRARAYLEKNMKTFAGVVVGAALLTILIFWFVRQRQSRIEETWASLNARQPGQSVSATLAEFQSIADSGAAPEAVLQAQLKIAGLAVGQMLVPEKASTDSLEKRDWPALAEQTYKKILESPATRRTAVAQAHYGLGIVAENRRHFDEARQHYKKIVDDPRFADDPIVAAAEYRLMHMDEWIAPIEFPPAPPPIFAAPGPPGGGPTTAPAGISFNLPTISTQPSESVPLMPEPPQSP